MDVYFVKSPQVATLRTLVLIGATLDLGATLYMIVLHLVRALNIGLLNTTSLLLALGVFHVLVAPAGFAAVITAIEPTYIFGAGIMSMLALVLDITALSLRATLDTGETDSFKTAALVGVSLWVGIDVYLIISTTAFSAWLVRWRARLEIYIKSKFGSRFLSDQFYKLPVKMFRSRRIIDAMWQVDLFLTIVVYVFFVLGLDPTETFSTLILLQTPHLFLWFWYRGVVGGPVDRLPTSATTSSVFIGVVTAFVLLDLALVLVGAVWRTYILATSSPGTFLLVTGSFTTAAVWILVVLDVTVLSAFGAYRSGVDKYHEDRASIVKQLSSGWNNREREDAIPDFAKDKSSDTN